MIFWITGKSGSGKTTLAHKIASQIDAIVIDGDETRKQFPEDFTYEGRERNQRRMVDIALSHKGNVVIACVSPNRKLRKELQAMLPSCIEIQLPFGTLWEGTEYEQ